MKKKLILRHIIFIIGIFIMGLAISLTAKSNLGTTPISSVPLLLAMITPLTIGELVFLLSLTFIILEFALLKGKFNKEQYLQLLIAPLLGYFIDEGMHIFSNIDPQIYWQKLIVLVISCFLIALGVYLQVIANVLINPTEGLVKIITDKTGMKFGNVKIIFDTSLLVIALVISLTAFHKIVSIREGTFVVAFATGSITKLYKKLFDKPVIGWLYK